jgi:hypothetical protein
MLGAFLVWLSHNHLQQQDEAGKLACFSTGPEITLLI